MITEVVEHDRLLERAHEIADIVNSNAPLAVRGTRLAIHKTLDLPLHEGEILAETFRERVVRTEDAARGSAGLHREAGTELAVPMRPRGAAVRDHPAGVRPHRPRRHHHAEPARPAELVQPHHVRGDAGRVADRQARRGHQRGGAAGGRHPGVQRRTGHQVRLRSARQRLEPRGSRRAAQPEVAEDVEARGLRRAGHVHRGRAVLRQRSRRRHLLRGRHVLRLPRQRRTGVRTGTRSG